MRHFLGFVAYLAKFIPQLSEVNAPLRAVLRADIIFDWQPAQGQAFHKLLDLCCQQPVLRYYDMKAPVEIHAVASQSGLGGVLMQEGKPVASTLRSLSEVEQWYAQVEKEMLAILHVCMKFHCHTFGKTVTVFTDHKPLQDIFKKNLFCLLPCVCRGCCYVCNGTISR